MPISSRYELMLIRSARRRGWTVEQEAAGPRYEAVDPGGMVRAWGIDSESDAWIEAGYLNEKDVEGEQERDVFLYRSASENPTPSPLTLGLIAAGVVAFLGVVIYKASQGPFTQTPFVTPPTPPPTTVWPPTPQQQADAADAVPPFVQGA